jgi:hypothetical protein
MKRSTILFALILSIMNYNLIAQDVYKVIYGDSIHMKKCLNPIHYHFKPGLKNGIWIAFYDSSFIDSALLVTVTNNQVNGKYKYWDSEFKYVTESGFYKNGLRNGIIHFWLLQDNNVMYENIERWVEDKFDGYIKQEW